MSHHQQPPPTSAAGTSRAARVLLVEFDSPGALITAAEQVRDAGYTKWDTHSPFPVHGIDEAMGIRPTLLPWIVFVCGVMGCIGGLVLVWWTNATSGLDFPEVPTHFQGYPFLISGKPSFSLPANIPVIFETTVLLAALAAVLGMMVMNNLPWHHNLLHNSERFRRVTADRFFLSIDATDPKFSAIQTEQFLATLGGTAVEQMHDDDSTAALPRWLVITLMVVACLALLPPLLVAKARFSTSTEPRIHIIQDMDNQERYQAQDAHPLFADGRAMRPPVPGTVARGDWPRDPHFHLGKTGEAWAATYPEQIEVTVPFVRRGQQQFTIYCAPCHGLGGAGDGIVSLRAFALETPGWVQPTSMLSELVLEQPHGQIFNSITNGIRTMPPYGDQIPEKDRWAIIAYIRALQRSQNASIEDVPPDLRPELR